MQHGWRAAVLAVFLFAASAGAALSQDATLDEARRLIDSKQPNEAFALLSPLEQQRAGDPEFDYLLGLAAVDSGRYTRGVFALERVLALRPAHAQARAEIARAYFLMGENKAAREEFEAVKRSGPPAAAAATIDRFLDALNQRERALGRTGVSAFLEAGLGYDNNANAATATTSFAIPLFPGLVFNLTPGSEKQSDDFWTLAGGASGRYGLTDAIALVGSVSFDRRSNLDFERFDTGSVEASGGVNLRRDADEFSLAAQLQGYSVDDERFRDAAGLVGQWRRAFSQYDQLTLYLQRARLAYPQQQARDAERTVLGAAWAHAYRGPLAPVAFAGFYAGKEDPRRSDVPHFGHDLWGLRAGGQIGISERWLVSASFGYEDRRYGGADPLFQVRRHDREAQLRLAAPYAFNRSWSVIPAATYVDSRSNIIVNDYQRTIVSLSVRYGFH
jgi:tetratricopeptide (TPR) repeat protein